MIHSFEPIIDKECKVLILGTMPSVQSLEKQQYYGNKQNTFWRIVYALFEENLSEDYEHRKGFLLKHHIALWDVMESCERDGSADSDIKSPVPNDFASLFKEHTGIERIYFNGKTAEKTFVKLVMKNLSDNCLKYITLSSTSPANVVRFEDKLQHWKLIKYELQGLKQNDI